MPNAPSWTVYPARRGLLSALSSTLGLTLVPTVAGAYRSGGLAPVVTLLGDSITAGLGLAAHDALPARLREALGALGVQAFVRGAGVSGDTSAGGLARVDFSVQPDTAVCVVELGANDYLQSIAPAETGRNLAALVRHLKSRGIRPVLARASVPARASGSFGREFEAMFERVARAEQIILTADLLSGVLGRSGLTQADGMHPNAAGVKLVAARLAPSIVKALAGKPAGRPR